METPAQLVTQLRDAKTLEEVQRSSAAILASIESFTESSLAGGFFAAIVSATRKAKESKAGSAPDAAGYVNVANSLLSCAKTCPILSENQKKRADEMLTELNSDNPLDRITPPEPREEGERPKRRRERGKKKAEGQSAPAATDANTPQTQESWNLVCTNASQLATTLEGFTGFKFSPRTIGHLRAALLHDSAFSDLPELRVRLADTEHMRLEFLGNSVLQTVAASYVFSQFKTSTSKQLDNLRKGLTDAKAATQYATKLNLGHLVLLGQGAAAGDANANNAKKPTLADTFRPVLGALFASGGMNPCQTLFKKIVDAPAAPAGQPAPTADGEGAGKRRNRRRGPRPAAEGAAGDAPAGGAAGEQAADGAAPRERRPRRGRGRGGAAAEGAAVAAEPAAA
eukprot:tig00001049_g6678.t1